MKSVKLHQYIPVPLIDIAVTAAIEGAMSTQYANEMALTAGVAKERTRKTANMLRAITLNNPLLPWISEYGDEFKHEFALPDNHSVLVTALLCSSFTLFYDAVVILGKYLHVQDEVSGALLKEQLSVMYGSNVNFTRALNTVTRMLIEIGVLKRVKPGLFARGELGNTSDFTRRLYRRSFLIHNPYEPDDATVECHPFFELIS